ncbi:hypothetical protein GCM10023170_049610 [Phytohabitans houttuyneae]|uniref:Uncharacterized protein n=1 Tax=Phytohabitans houttuyneae TaxID=1076126 RepID=A0A6V8KIK7_9ACTN|nr:hypothetical protein Phou_092230 [Phytohabitans houttuyneae]
MVKSNATTTASAVVSTWRSAKAIDLMLSGPEPALAGAATITVSPDAATATVKAARSRRTPARKSTVDLPVVSPPSGEEGPGSISEGGKG